jgi:hypothetical protein
MSFPFLYILNSLPSSLTVYILPSSSTYEYKYKYKYILITFLKRLQRLKQEWQKSSSGTRQTDGKNLVWFGEIESKLAKLSKTTYFYLPFFLLIILCLNYSGLDSHVSCLSHTAYTIYIHTQTHHHTPHTQTNTDVSQLNISHISNTCNAVPCSSWQRL